MCQERLGLTLTRRFLCVPASWSACPLFSILENVADRASGISVRKAGREYVVHKSLENKWLLIRLPGIGAKHGELPLPARWEGKPTAVERETHHAGKPFSGHGASLHAWGVCFFQKSIGTSVCPFFILGSSFFLSNSLRASPLSSTTGRMLAASSSVMSPFRASRSAMRR